MYLSWPAIADKDMHGLVHCVCRCIGIEGFFNKNNKITMIDKPKVN